MSYPVSTTGVGMSWYKAGNGKMGRQLTDDWFQTGAGKQYLGYQKARGGLYGKKRVRRTKGGNYVRRKKAFNPRTGGVLGVEHKWYDTFIVNSVVGTPNGAQNGVHNPITEGALNAVAQGDGPSNRDGRKISMTKIMVRGKIQEDATIESTGTFPHLYLVALVLDTQCNGLKPNSEDIFENISGQGENAINVYNNMEFSPRFRVLKRITLNSQDKSITQSDQAGVIVVNGSEVYFELIHDLGGLKTSFGTGTNSVVANIVDNSLSVVIYSSGQGTNPTVSYNARLRFVG